MKLPYVVLAIVCSAFAAASAQNASTIVNSEFLYEKAPFPSAHASTIIETTSGLVSAWFGGTAERRPDVGIWVSRREGGAWSTPVEVANGVQPDGTRHPTWNPVLFQPPGGPLVLFYKVGPSPSQWWGMVRVSPDDGRTWSAAAKLPDGILGPIRAKPVLLGDGTLLAGSSTEHDGWVVHMERFTPGKRRWTLESLADPSAWKRTAPLNDKQEFGAIQPTILVHAPKRIQILCRSRQQAITESWSADGGVTWSPMQKTALPNPSSGIDAVRLTDGRFALVYNPSPTDRRRLVVATSTDGKAWTEIAGLENTPGEAVEYSYPAMIQARDGLLHVTYTWKRQRIRHAVVDPARKLP